MSSTFPLFTHAIRNDNAQQRPKALVAITSVHLDTDRICVVYGVYRKCFLLNPSSSAMRKLFSYLRVEYHGELQSTVRLVEFY